MIVRTHAPDHPAVLEAAKPEPGTHRADRPTDAPPTTGAKYGKPGRYRGAHRGRSLLAWLDTLGWAR